MGLMLSKVWTSLVGNKEIRVLILGLDNAGKTTILYKLHMGEVVTTVPTCACSVRPVHRAAQLPRKACGGRAARGRVRTGDANRRRTRSRPCSLTLRRARASRATRSIGFNVETVQYKNLRFQVWDLGGQTSIRPYWRCYYQNTNAIIYVVDSADSERMGISKQVCAHPPAPWLRARHRGRACGSAVVAAPRDVARAHLSRACTDRVTQLHASRLGPTGVGRLRSARPVT